MQRGALVTALWALAGCSLPPLARFEEIAFPGVHSPRGAPVSVRFDRAFETGDEVALTIALTRSLRVGRGFSGPDVEQRDRRVRLECRVVMLALSRDRAPSLVEVLVDRATVDNDDTAARFEKPGESEFAAMPSVLPGTRATLAINEHGVGVQRINQQAPPAALAELFVRLFSGSTLEALSGSLFGDVQSRRVGEHWLVGTTTMPSSNGARRLVSYNARLDWRGTHQGADAVRLRGWAVSPEFTTGTVGEDMVRNRVVVERSLVAPVDGQRLPFALRERRVVDSVGYATETMVFRNGGTVQERVPRAESLIETIEVSYDRFTPAPPSRPAPNRVEGGEGEGVATK